MKTYFKYRMSHCIPGRHAIAAIEGLHDCIRSAPQCDHIVKPAPHALAKMIVEKFYEQ
jgi:hypothetical protein